MSITYYTNQKGTPQPHVDIDPKTLKELNDPANRVTMEAKTEFCVYTVYKGKTNQKIATLTIDNIESTCFYNNKVSDDGGLLYNKEVYLKLLEELSTRSNTNTK